MDDTTAGVLMILGSVTFGVGAAIGVPGVFTERDPQRRLRMLEEGRVRWLWAQPLYALGPLIAPLGVSDLSASTNVRLLDASSALLFVGAIAWTWSVYLRSTRMRAFALGELPGWPFASYVVLTIGGLALLGAGLVADGPVWLGWLVLVADALFLGAYVRFKDIPPFVFYVVLTVVGVAVL